jgi:hypothetical protein
MVYPVSGTQATVAGSIVVLGAFAALLHSLDELLGAIPSRLQFAASQWVLCGLILLILFCVGAWNVTKALNRPGQAARYLPNSRLIQLSAEEYETFSEISSSASRRCDALVTIPGMNSFNIWSNVSHPNGFVVAAGMVLFDEPTQERLLKDFWTVRRPCVVLNPDLERWSARFRPQRPHQPFVDMVHNELVPVYSRSGYEIRVPRRQVPEWH